MISVPKVGREERKQLATAPLVSYWRNAIFEITTHPMDVCCARSGRSAIPELAAWTMCVACVSSTAPRQCSRLGGSGQICSGSSDYIGGFKRVNSYISKERVQAWDRRRVELLPYSHLSSASFIQRSKTGLIFCALFGVMSNFSNLCKEGVESGHYKRKARISKI